MGSLILSLPRVIFGYLFIIKFINSFIEDLRFAKFFPLGVTNFSILEVPTVEYFIMLMAFSIMNF